MKKLNTVLLALAVFSGPAFAECGESSLIGRGCGFASSLKNKHYTTGGAVAAAAAGITVGWLGAAALTPNKIVKSTSAGISGAILGGLTYFLMNKLLGPDESCQNEVEVEAPDLPFAEKLYDELLVNRPSDITSHSEKIIEDKAPSEPPMTLVDEIKKGVKLKPVADRELALKKESDLSEDLVKKLEDILKKRRTAIEISSDTSGTEEGEAYQSSDDESDWI